MPFNWKDYLSLASEIELNIKKTNPLQEAYFRSAISRAYYAAYHLTFGYVTASNIYKPPKNAAYTHTDMPTKLISERDVDIKKLGANLRLIKGYRIDCDYMASVSSLEPKLRTALIAVNDSVKILISKGHSI